MIALKKSEHFVKNAKFENTILFGPENSSKYTQALFIVEKFSPSKLNYSRKIEIENNGDKYQFNISDIHFEIDFELLGTNENSLWLEYISTVNSIIDTKEMGFIICKNMHCMKDELMSIFHTFMRNKKLKFIILTKHISYFPLSIKNRCKIYHLKKLNIKSYSFQYKIDCDKIVNYIISQNNDLFILRELLYQLLTFNYNINDCFQYIFFKLIQKQFIPQSKISECFKNMISILKKYNTNYRPIYHLELFILNIYCM